MIKTIAMAENNLLQKADMEKAYDAATCSNT